MNVKFKKAVSTAAAVALLASVFSGFSLTTASAAAIMIETKYIGSKSTAETFTDYKINSETGSTTIDTGTNNWANPSSKTDGKWTFIWNADGRKNYTYGGVKDISADISGKDSANYTDGTVFGVLVRGGAENFMMYNFDDAVSSGTVYLSTDLVTYVDKNNLYDEGVVFRDASGSDVLKLYENSGKGQFCINSGNNYMAAWDAREAGANNTGAHIEAEINLDTKKAKVTFQREGSDAVVKKDIDIAATNIKSFGVFAHGSSSTNTYSAIDNTKLYHIGEVSPDQAVAVAPSDADYGIGTWTYDGNVLGGTTAKTSAGVHYSGLKFENSEGRKAVTIQVPFAKLPADGRVIELYTGVPASYDIANGIAKYNNVTLGDKTIKNFTDEKLFGETGDADTVGIDLANKKKIASISFSTKDKKRYITIAGDTFDTTTEEAADGYEASIPINDVDFGEYDDLFLYNDYQGDNKADLDGGSIGNENGTLVMTYAPKAADVISVVSEPDVFKVSGTETNPVIYLGKYNTKDLTSIKLTGKGNKDVASSVVLYESDTKTDDLSSAKVISATGDNAPTFPKAAVDDNGNPITENAMIGVVGASGESKHIYVALSATKDNKAVTPAQISGASAEYLSLDMTQAGLTAQYLLENITIDSTKVFDKGAFDETYYNKFTSTAVPNGYITRIQNAKTQTGADVEAVFTKFANEYAQLTGQAAGWAVVKEISNKLPTYYTEVTKEHETEDTFDAYTYLNTKVDGTAPRTIILGTPTVEEDDLGVGVNEQYEQLNPIGQGFVGGQNYDVLYTLVKILKDGDKAIIDAYNNILNNVWDKDANEGAGASKLTQDNYLYAGEAIADLYELITDFDNYHEDVQAQLDKTELEKARDAIKKQVVDGDAAADPAVKAFIDVTAEQFNAAFTKVDAAYKAAETYADKTAALKFDGIDSLYAEIEAFETALTDVTDYAAKISTKINETTLDGNTKANYTQYEAYRAQVDTYAKAQQYIDAVNALKASIDANQGVNKDTYETTAEAYNAAMAVRAEYEAAAAVEGAAIPADDAIMETLTEADTYMTAADRVISSALEGIIQKAKDALDDTAADTVANNKQTIVDIKWALHLYDALLSDHTNANLGHAQAALAAMAVGETEQTYGELVEKITADLATYTEENTKAITKLYDDNTADLTTAVAAYNYKTTDFSAITTYKGKLDEAKALNELVQLANGTARDKKAKDEKSPVTTDTLGAVDASSANTADFDKINAAYNKAVAFQESITFAKTDSKPNGLKEAGTAYEAAVVALAKMVDSSVDAADTITSWTDEDIASKVETAYENGKIYFTSEVGDESKATVAKNTKDNRAALTTTLTDYQRAIGVYDSNFVANTDNTATDFDLDPETRAYATPWADQTIIDAAAKLEAAIGAKLAVEQQIAEGYQADMDTVSDTAKAAVDALMSEIDALYNKLSDPACAYTSADEIAADKDTYAALAARPAVERQTAAYRYVGKNALGEDVDINYYDEHYKAAAGASKLAYIESALETWESAWAIIEEAKAIEGMNVPVKDDTTNTWSVDKETEFDAVKDKYDKLKTEKTEAGDVPGAEKVNVNNVLGETYFADQAATNDMLNDVITNYANKLAKIGTINSVPTYKAGKDDLEAVNKYVATLEAYTAATADEEITLPDESTDTATQDKIDDAKAKLAAIDTYFAAEKALLAADNDAAEVIAPAYEFDELVNAVENKDDTEDMAKATAKLNEILAMDNASDVMKYVTQYARYESLLNETDLAAVAVFKTAVEAAQNIEDSYADPKAAEFKKAYDAAMAEYDKLTDVQKDKASLVLADLNNAKATNDKYAAGNKAATDVNAEIQNVYNNVSTTMNASNYDEYKAQYEAVSTTVDSILKDYDGQDGAYALITNKGLVADTKTKLDEFAPVKKAVDAIDAIGDVTAPTAETVKAVEAARAAYDAIATQTLKNEVSNYAVLVAAEEAIANNADVQAAKAAAETVEAAIDAIGTVTAPVDDETKAKIEAARAAYDAADDLTKSFVDNYAKLTDAEALLAPPADVTGDVNNDGTVDGRDILTVIDYILGRTELDAEQLKRADANNSGKVDVNDILTMIGIWGQN